MEWNATDKNAMWLQNQCLWWNKQTTTKKKKREKNTFNSENNIYGINFGWGAFKIRLRILKNCTELKKLNEIAKYLFVVVIKLCHSITVSL